MGVHQADAAEAEDRNEGRLKVRVTLIGALVNLALAALKVVVGVLGHSQALVVDGIHSLSDLVSDAIVLFAAHSASKGPDYDHPYGHQRFETAATVAVGVLLLMVAGGFVYDAVLRLTTPGAVQVPGWMVLPAAVASVLAKEGVYQYTARVGRRVKSPLIEANAWHHRSDALSSLVVIGAFLGSVAGFPWLDAVAAIIVAGMVGLMGWQFAWQSVRELVDTGLEPEKLRELSQLINSVDGVRSHHNLRTRLMAGQALVDVHVLVDPWISVSEGHRICEEVERRLVAHIDQASEVLVHVDAERLTAGGEARPPLRGQVIGDLDAAWQGIPEAQAATHATLHYRGDQLTVELHVPASAVDVEQIPGLAERLRRAAAHLGYIGEVRLLLEHPGSG